MQSYMGFHRVTGIKIENYVLRPTDGRPACPCRSIEVTTTDGSEARIVFFIEHESELANEVVALSTPAVAA